MIRRQSKEVVAAVETERMEMVGAEEVAEVVTATGMITCQEMRDTL